MSLNGIISFEGVVTLLAVDFFQVETFLVRSGLARRRSIEAIWITEQGPSYRDNYALHAPDPDACFDGFEASIRSYAAIDLGIGLAATRDVLEAALDINDGDLLSRIRFLPSGEPVLPPGSIPGRVTDDERMAMMDFLSPSDAPRRGAMIVDVSAADLK